jgi:hypothetical protein
MNEFFIKHPLRTFLVLSVIISLVIAYTNFGPGDFLSENWKILSGCALFVVLLYQFSLFYGKLRNKLTGETNIFRHRFASYISVTLFLIHISGSGNNWNLFLFFFTIMTIVAAIVSRSMYKYKSRNGLLRQYLLHTFFGALMIAAAIPHAMVAVAFE